MPDQRRPDDVCYTLRPAVTLREELAKWESFDSLRSSLYDPVSVRFCPRRKKRLTLCSHEPALLFWHPHEKTEKMEKTKPQNDLRHPAT